MDTRTQKIGEIYSWKEVRGVCSNNDAAVPEGHLFISSVAVKVSSLRVLVTLYLAEIKAIWSRERRGEFIPHRSLRAAYLERPPRQRCGNKVPSPPSPARPAVPATAPQSRLQVDGWGCDAERVFSGTTFGSFKG